MIAAQSPSAKEERYHVNTDSVNYDERLQVINHYDSFGIFDRWGDIHKHGKKAQGIFYKGTRFINQLELKINEKKPLLLSSAIKQNNEILSVDLTNTDLYDCDVKENTVHIEREQVLRNGIFYEQITLTNYGEKTCRFDLSLNFDADFSDIFEIRGMSREVTPPEPTFTTSSNKIIFSYTGLDGIERRTEILVNKDGGGEIDNSSVHFPLRLKHQQKHQIGYAIYCFTEENTLSRNDTEKPDLTRVRKNIQKDIQTSRLLFANISSDNEKFNNWIERSTSDLQSLLTETEYGNYPYAGVPWYNTPFGRDGIITAMEVIWIAPKIAKDVLIFLAATQSTQMSVAQDAEPGKIVHEIRWGEMANTGEVPFKKYYGTIDATPLFLMLAGMYYRQTGDLSFIKKIWPNIQAAINWIDVYGDIDKDGFVEYSNQSEKGLTNQGWKDSYDSVMYSNGDLCKGPIALCEVQAYVYAAKKHVAEMAAAMHEKEYAGVLRDQAAALQKQFNEKFWSEELGAYVLALDGDKKQCKVLASNMGHCLFCGIAEPHHARKVAKHLTSDNMFSGWGVRTLAEGSVLFNPMSYHNGSVWPHDNALIAFGLSSYGYHAEALKILQGLFDASLYLDLQRLPELFCGFPRRPNEGTTAYPVACSPQAWAVGAVFLLLQASLQIEVNAITKTITFNKPQLPSFLNKLVIRNIVAGDDLFHFELYRHQYDVGFHVMNKPEDWEMIIRK